MEGAFHLLFMAATVGVVAGGVKAGIERTAMVLMPVLFTIVCGLALYASTLDGAPSPVSLSVSFAPIVALSPSSVSVFTGTRHSLRA